MASSTENQSQPAGSSGSSQNSTGSVIRLVIFLLVVVVVIGAAGWGASRLLGGLSEDPTATMLTHRVQTGELLITVTEDGNVESASNVDIKCQVAGGSSILSIVSDGEQVEAGDLLVALVVVQLGVLPGEHTALVAELPGVGLDRSRTCMPKIKLAPFLAKK